MEKKYDIAEWLLPPYFLLHKKQFNIWISQFSTKLFHLKFNHFNPQSCIQYSFFAVVSIVTECYMPPCHVKYSPGACVHVSQIENPFERETMVCCKHIYSLCLFLRVAIKYNIAKILAN